MFTSLMKARLYEHHDCLVPAILYIKDVNAMRCSIDKLIHIIRGNLVMKALH